MKLRDSQYEIVLPNGLGVDGQMPSGESLPKTLSVGLRVYGYAPVPIALEQLRPHPEEADAYLADVTGTEGRMKLYYDAGEWMADVIRPRPVDLLVGFTARQKVTNDALTSLVGGSIYGLSFPRWCLMVAALCGNALLLPVVLATGLTMLVIVGEPMWLVYAGCVLGPVLAAWNMWLWEREKSVGDRNGMRYLRVHFALMMIGCGLYMLAVATAVHHLIGELA